MAQVKPSRETVAVRRQAEKAWYTVEAKLRRHIDAALEARKELTELSRIIGLNLPDSKPPG